MPKTFNLPVKHTIERKLGADLQGDDLTLAAVGVDLTLAAVVIAGVADLILVLAVVVDAALAVGIVGAVDTAVMADVTCLA